MKKPLYYLWVFALATTAVGCKVSKQDVELLERDLRIQEDEIYALQDCVDAYRKKLESCRSENRALRSALSGKGGAADDFVPPTAAPSAPSFDPGPGGSLPSTGAPGFPRELDPGQMEEAPPFQPPAISPPGEATEGIPVEPGTPAEGVPPGLIESGPLGTSSSKAGAASAAALVAHHEPRGAGGEGKARALLDRLSAANQEPPVTDPVHDLEVTEITLNRMLTGGMNRDHRNGDEGILVIIEPRNNKNQIVQAFGEVSIVLLDPALEGEAARVARWDFTPAELENHFRSNRFGRGLQLELPWPGEPPQHSELHLFVRFVSDNGQKLIVDRELKIDPPGGEAAGGWVPASRTRTVVNEVEMTPTTEVETAPVAKSTAIPTRPLPTLAPPEAAAARKSEPELAQPAAAVERAEARVAAAPVEQPAEKNAKRRPQWTPYRK